MGYVQGDGKEWGGSQGTTEFITLSNVLAGSFIPVAIGWFDASVSLLGVNDGTAYTFIGEVTPSGGRTALYYKKNSTAGSKTITATFSGDPNFGAMAGHEVSGFADLDVFVLHPTIQFAGIATDSITSDAVTTGFNGEYVFGFAWAPSGNNWDAIAGTNGFTLRKGGANQRYATEDQIQTSAGSIAALFTSASNDNFLAAVATFKVAASGTTYAQLERGTRGALRGQPGRI